MSTDEQGQRFISLCVYTIAAFVILLILFRCWYYIKSRTTQPADPPAERNDTDTKKKESVSVGGGGGGMSEDPLVV